MTGFLLASVVIVAIVAVLVGYAIKNLASTPLRIVAVISAITALVFALPALFESLRPADPAAEPGVQAPAPTTPPPATPVPAPPPPAPGPTATPGTASSSPGAVPGAYTSHHGQAGGGAL
ncbi:hypothetical protein [Streptomyces sp. NPDC055060]